MCGIAGFVRFHRAENTGLLERLTAPLQHRGPDDEGYALWETGRERIRAYSGPDTQRSLNPPLPLLPPDAVCRAGLGFRRLSIQDLTSCGHQPMLSEDQQVALTFNGEIFNAIALRQELEAVGAHFVSHSDTEVILHGYLHHGIAWIERLAGMFAIAILDRRTEVMYLVRDRLGIKPLFVHNAPHGVYWASEAKALVDAGIFRATPDWTGLATAFALQAPVLPHTCFREVKLVEPGTFWRLDAAHGGVSVERYWRIPANATQERLSEEDAASELETRLRKTTQDYLLSDVPVATLMSGGLDSTLVTAFAREAAPVEAFTLSIDGSGDGLDEAPQARAIAEHLGVKHRVVPFDRQRFLHSLPASLANAEAPYPFLEPVEYTAAALHEAGYKVVLNGLGADELFGGYGFYDAYETWRRRAWAAPLATLIPPLSTTLRKARAAVGLRDAVAFWAHQRVGLKRHELRSLFDASTVHQSVVSPANLLRRQTGLTGVDKDALLHLDIFHNVGAHHSLREDASYMAHSVEARYPFLDHTLVEWAASLPSEIRYKPGVPKHLVRSVAQKYLPASALQMKKKGFNLPFGGALWDEAFFSDLCRDHLTTLKGRDIVSTKVLERWWKRRREPFFFHRVWLAVTLEAWWRRFIESPGPKG